VTATKTPAKRKPAPRRTARPAQVSRSAITSGRSLTAAAQILHGRRLERSIKPKTQQGLQWQIDAWDFYDKVGEFALGIDMQAWAVSQVRLAAAIEVPSQDEPEFVVADVDLDGDGEDEPVSEADRIAAELVADFAGGSIGQQQLMRRVATQLGVAAESYIVGRSDPEGDGEDVWEAYSREEVKWGSNGWRVDDGVDKFWLGPEDVMIRVWIPHPRYRQQPRSSTKAILPDLQEIWALTQSINAQVDSRLAGAGLLIFPKSVELVGSGKAGDDDEDDEDQFMNEFIDMVVTPIKDRDSASAVVPFMVKVDDEAVGKIQYLRFESTANLEEAEKREKAITRLARGMDLPPEQILGTGGMNHWGAWLVAEDTIKGPVSNLASIIVHALTLAWYRPALETAYEAAELPDEDVESIRNRMLWFDTTPLEQRPDRSAQARDVFDRGGLSIAALVRESGFNEADMPDPEELLRIAVFLLLKTKPELVLPLMDGSGLLEQILQTEPRELADAVQDERPDDGAGLDGRELPADPGTPDEAAPDGGDAP
jgi:hypothetical protein